KLEEKRLKDSVAAAERDRLSINLEGLILDVPRAKPESFPPLPEDALELVRRAWNKRLPDDEVFADNGIVKIHRKDLLTLSGLDWLNDEIINFYLDLVCKRSKSDPDLPKVYAFQTFFYTTLCQRGYGDVKRWTKKVDVFSYDIWLVPVHLQVHWCMAVVDLQNKTIEYYDSMLGKNSVYAFQTFFYTTLCQRGYGGVKRWTKKVDVFSYDIWLVPVHLQVHWCMAVVDLQNKTIEYYDSMLGKNSVVFELLTEYLSSESMDKRKQPLNTNDWKLIRKCDIPTQQNGSDCGMFSCKFGEYASRRAEIDFSQKNMPYFRQRMVYEICQQQLM
uniref:Ubiquitin-like protease family profile domain-containing protein n=1 Tax=Panagrolaimus sp. JU765 TaxID=591449 RepID=A0AC34R3D4_9BILA